MSEEQRACADFAILLLLAQAALLGLGVVRVVVSPPSRVQGGPGEGDWTPLVVMLAESESIVKVVQLTIGQKTATVE